MNTGWLRTGISAAALAALAGCSTSQLGSLASSLTKGDTGQKSTSSDDKSASNKDLFKDLSARELLAAKGTLSTKALMLGLSGGSDGSPATTDSALTKPTGNALLDSMKDSATQYLKEEAKKKLTQLTDSIKAMLPESTSTSDADNWFAGLSSRQELLDSVKVSVPSFTGSATPIGKRAESFARYLAAMKVSNLVIKQGELDLDGYKKSYSEYNAQVEKLSSQLVAKNYALNGLLKIGSAPPSLTKDEYEYIKRFDKKPLPELQAMPEWDRVQAILDKALAAQPGNRKDFALLDTRKTELVTHYRAYGKTAVGATAMLAFGVPFLTKSTDLFQSGTRTEMGLVSTMLLDGGNELYKSVESATKSYNRNDPLRNGTFTLLDEAGATRKADVSATDLLTTLPPEDRQALLDQWVGSENAQLVRLHARAPRLAGEVLDRDLSSSAREGLIKSLGYKGDVNEFRFATAASSTLPIYSGMARALRSKLYEAGYTPNDSGNAFAVAQAELRSKFSSRVNARDLRLMIFSQAEGPWIQAGKTRIVLEQPGLEGLSDKDAFYKEVGNVIVPNAAVAGSSVRRRT